MKTDYGHYRFTLKEMAKYLAQSVLLGGTVNYLFYQSPWLLLLQIPFSAVYLKIKKKQLIQERKKQLNYQFKDALNAMSVAVQAGYSVENAVTACVRDLEGMYEKGTDIVEEFRWMEHQKNVSVPVEELFWQFGERSGIEDIQNFASVFYTAKRTGGDMEKIIQQVARMLGDKIDVKKEIETAVSAKKSEQWIMSLMPAGIILYLQVTSPGFLSVLYGNWFGVCMMTACAGIYGAAWWMGKRIVDIEV